MAVESPDVMLNAFAEVARSFCHWAENDELEPDAAHQHLADLHSSILRIVLITPKTSDLPDDHVTHDDWKLVFTRFQALLPTIYRNIYDPLEEEPKVDVVQLADDMADIYRDVKEGLVLFDKGLFDDANWEWRYNFQIHWGRHLTSALTAIHAHTAGPMRL